MRQGSIKRAKILSNQPNKIKNIFPNKNSTLIGHVKGIQKPTGITPIAKTEAFEKKKNDNIEL